MDLHRSRATGACLLGVMALLAVSLVSAEEAAGAPAVPEDRRPTVAVLYFDYTGQAAELGVLRKGLAQMIISDISDCEKVRIVERDRLQEVLQELDLARSSKIAKDSAAQVGKLLGARYMVLGGYFELMGSLRVDARVVEVETGKIVRAVGVTGTPGDFLDVEQKLATELEEILGGVLAPLEKKPTRKPAKRPRRSRPKPPKKLRTKTALRYAKALDAKDQKDVPTARKELEAVIAEQPDFELAKLDLAALMQ